MGYRTTRRQMNAAARRRESRTVIQRAAIAACHALNCGRCSCENSPSVCDSMVLAVRAALLIAAPDVYEQMALIAMETARLKRAQGGTPQGKEG